MCADQVDLAVLGGFGVDTVVHLPALPPPLADSIQVPPIRDHPGQTGAGIALGTRALGASVACTDLIGADPQGESIRQLLAGCDFRPVLHSAGTRRAVNLMSPDGARISCFDARQPPEATLPEEVWGPLVARAGRVHACISGWVRHAVPAFASYGRPLSTDLHDWDGENPYHVPFAESAELVFLSAARLGGRWDAALRAILDRGRARAVIATDGAAGAWLAERGAVGIVHVPAAPLPGPAVDSNGAGDAFACGMLHALDGGAALRDAVVAGTVAGAFACTVAGAAGGFIDAPGLAAGVAALS